MISHYWYFVDLNYTYEPYEPEVCNGSHDISMMTMNWKILQY